MLWQHHTALWLQTKLDFFLVKTHKLFPQNDLGIQFNLPTAHSLDLSPASV